VWWVPLVNALAKSMFSRCRHGSQCRKQIELFSTFAILHTHYITNEEGKIGNSGELRKFKGWKKNSHLLKYDISSL
jgi:hypothetical protein